jgi:sporulation protein YlmC with PRC-barrel domain
MPLPPPETARAWQGLSVIDPDGASLGSVADIYLDRETGQPEWALVDPDWSDQSAFVPLTDARQEGQQVVVDYRRDQIEGAPSIPPGGELSEQDEVRLYEHYGISYSTAGSASGLPAGEPAQPHLRVEPPPAPVGETGRTVPASALPMAAAAALAAAGTVGLVLRRRRAKQRARQAALPQALSPAALAKRAAEAVRDAPKRVPTWEQLQHVPSWDELPEEATKAGRKALATAKAGGAGVLTAGARLGAVGVEAGRARARAGAKAGSKAGARGMKAGARIAGTAVEAGLAAAGAAAEVAREAAKGGAKAAKAGADGAAGAAGVVTDRGRKARREAKRASRRLAAAAAVSAKAAGRRGRGAGKAGRKQAEELGQAVTGAVQAAGAKAKAAGALAGEDLRAPIDAIDTIRKQTKASREQTRAREAELKARKRRKRRRTRLGLALGAWAGYVVGTRDGRERYEQLKGAASRLADDPTVDRLKAEVSSVVNTGRERAGQAVEDAGNAAADQVRRGRSSLEDTEDT